jgi:hypothetical protein
MMHLKNNSKLKENTDLGDQRLNARYSKICTKLSSNLSGSIPSSHENRDQSKATYRFFDNEKVSPDKLIEGHLSVHQAPLQEGDTSLLLMLQDTSGLVFTGKKGAKQLGPLNYKHNRGFYLHTSLIVSPKGVPIGLFKETFIERTLSKLGKGAERRGLPIEEKETYRWLSHFQAAQDYFANQSKVKILSIADREADFFELLRAYDEDKAPNIHYLIRSKHDRRLAGTANQTISDKLDNSPVRGQCEVEVTDRTTAKKRVAKVDIKYEPVAIQLHKPMPGKRHLGAINIGLIQASEINPPKGVKPANWTLLTSHAIESLAEAKQFIRYYALRWLIERFFYILKQGAKVEELQLGTPQRLKNAIATYSVVACNIMRANYLARHHPQLSIFEAGITLQEYEALYQYLHHFVDKRLSYDPLKPPNISQFVEKIAQLGGYIKSKRQPYPGLKTMWRGVKKYELIFKIYSMSKNS